MTKLRNVWLGLSLGAWLFAAVGNGQTPVDANTFRNPLLPSGADPWVTQADGFYYYMNSTGRNLTIWKTRDITDLAHAMKKVVWTPPPGKPYSHEVWAPELHRMDGKWYIYFAADDGENRSHRIYVVENSSQDPLEGSWNFKGQVGDSTNKWAIDATVFQNKGRWYLLWSGWEGDTNGEQRIYIARLKNPWTVGSARVMLSRPQYPWERVNARPGRPNDPKVEVNEGPEILEHDGKVFLVYSGSGCWTDDYELGVLEADADADMLDPKSWKKFDHPFFKQSAAASAFGTGHNGFFKSPDGKEDWIIYHANAGPGEGCGTDRAPRMQRFTWNADGTPDFGKPVPLDAILGKPSH
jgi:GH43 family beta-xylosidase